MAIKDKALKKRKALDALFYLSFMIIPLITFLVFYVYVNVDSFIMAFQKPEDGKLTFAGIENFKWVFEKIKYGSTIEQDNIRLAFVNTFKTFGVQLVMFPVGLFVSYFIYKKILGYKAFRVIFYLPTIISGVVVSFFYLKFMQNGFMPKLLTKLYHLDYNLTNPLIDSRFANKMVLLHFIWLSFPGQLIIWGGTFSRIPESIIESAKLDGVSWVREMFGIILPLVWPTFVLMITLQISGVFGSSGAVFLLTQGQKGTQTVSNWMYMQIYYSNDPQASQSLYRVAAMGMMLTFISCMIAILVRKFLVSRIEETTY